MKKVILILFLLPLTALARSTGNSGETGAATTSPIDKGAIYKNTRLGWPIRPVDSEFNKTYGECVKAMNALNKKNGDWPMYTVSNGFIVTNDSDGATIYTKAGSATVGGDSPNCKSSSQEKIPQGFIAI